jgi:ATP:ADP antiporter, AAA family
VNAVARALKIHPGEGRLAISMIALSFLVLAGQAIGQSGVTGLFVAQVGTDALPLVYLLQGGAALALTIVLAALLGRVDQRRAYLGMSAALLVVVVAERVVLGTGSAWIYWALWLTVALAVLVQTVVVWGVAGVVTDTRQAKRLFPLFAAGGILGSVIGGVITAPLVQLVGTAGLLVVWAATLAGALVSAWLVLDARSIPRSAHHRVRVLRDLAAAWRYVSGSALLRWMTLAAVLFSVLFFSLFLPFAAAASARYPSADDLAGFFGLFAALTTAAAFLISTVGTNRMFARFGVVAAVMILPLLYVGSFGALLVTATLASLVTVRAITTIWLQGVASPAWETLTNVVPDRRRDQVRAFLNGGPSQAGTAIAGVIALVGTDVLSAPQLTVVGLVTAAITLFVTWRIKRSYAAALVDALLAGRPVFTDDATLVVPFTIDRDAQAVGSVLAAAGDPDPSVRQLSAQLLADVEDARAATALEGLLNDPQPVVAATAAVALSAAQPNRPDLEARLGSQIADPDPSVRAGTLVALRGSPGPLAARLASDAVDDEDPSVRATAIVTLATADGDAGRSASLAHLDDPSPRVRRAAARAVAATGGATVGPLLDALERPAAREAALDALTRIELAGDLEAVRGFS